MKKLLSFLCILTIGICQFRDDGRLQSSFKAEQDDNGYYTEDMFSGKEYATSGRVVSLDILNQIEADYDASPSKQYSQEEINNIGFAV